MVTPSVCALRASEVNVRTTPLTCGCQASVAISTRIKPISAARRSVGSLAESHATTLRFHISTV